MRCRKVRSYLSAYSNEELTGSNRLAVDEHLSGCAECRKEEELYQALSTAKTNLDKYKVSDDFNARLLNRIGYERFAETRSKAYLPQKAPRIIWSKAIPIFMSACLVFAVSYMNFGSFDNNQLDQEFVANTPLDDSYLTVQPTNNPNLTVDLNKNWSFSKQMERTERINRISHNLTPRGSFSSGTTQLAGTKSSTPIPYTQYYHRVRPVIRIYVSPHSTTGKEGSGEY